MLLLVLPVFVTLTHCCCLTLTPYIGSDLLNDDNTTPPHPQLPYADTCPTLPPALLLPLITDFYPPAADIVTVCIDGWLLDDYFCLPFTARFYHLPAHYLHHLLMTLCCVVVTIPVCSCLPPASSADTVTPTPPTCHLVVIVNYHHHLPPTCLVVITGGG